MFPEICSSLARLVIMSETLIHIYFVVRLEFDELVLQYDFCQKLKSHRQKDLHDRFPLFGFSKSHTLTLQIPAFRSKKYLKTGFLEDKNHRIKGQGSFQKEIK